MTQKSSPRWLFYVALGSAFAAMATHFYLSTHYFELQLGQSSGSSLCNINPTFSCDTVSASRYSAFFGIPMAIWGLTTQLILVLITLIYGLNLTTDRYRIGRYAFFLGLFTAAVSLIMGGISLMVLSAFCLFCMGTYLLSFVYLFCLWKMQPHSPFKHFRSDVSAALGPFKWVGISVLSILPLGFLFNGMFLDHYGGSRLKNVVESSFIGWQGAPLNQFTEEGLVKGPADARLTIVEFADFLCPHCKNAAAGLKVFSDSHPKVRVIFKVFPLDGNCSANTEMPKGDGTRCLIPKTVFCAEKLAQKGWTFLDEFFKRQEEFFSPGRATDLIKEMVDRHGLSATEMESCRNSEEIHKTIVNQAQEGLNAKIEGTPSIFANGRFLSRGHLLPVLQRVFNSLE